MSRAIKVENLSKAYQLGQFGTNTISGDVQRWWETKILGKEDPFLRIGETNDQTQKGETNIVWSLKDINFEVEQGETLGIIGQNGAGKSTLLKILSRVTSPTKGGFKIKGRVASLLEVGTGFHPELSGRENIFLNGAILGMRKWEIKKRLDEIVEFAGVERYLDTPVKRYSSGMYVRLAFAVAAHLDAEILVVDEVLAVGDAEFQKKCIGKMGDISKGQGRTILFVSHNLTSIEKLCPKSVLLDKGRLDLFSDTSKVIGKYFKRNLGKVKNLENYTIREGNGDLIFCELVVEQESSESIQNFLTPFLATIFKLKIKRQINKSFFNWRIDLGINDLYDRRVAWLSSNIKEDKLELYEYNEFIFKVDSLSLAPGDYNINLNCEVNNEVADYIKAVYSFKVLNRNLWEGAEKLRENFMPILLNFNINNTNAEKNKGIS
ncbi:ABC transporter ATP-binding protein [Cecembia lonarensis]|uniref:Teichoic acids export ATP-binding protein TagH n=1 Tax=Cecembia lonarensis (strain CCUG 58316 / KCTC 22772 / LW9) TaxID=1225176 RepID=K1KXA0_CECL9|nr:polysaccharide ABC transporter ATP-binding protein [Cecembia lonarensis]EKB48715.1 Teichoic acids export ATP-binding protein TagH [Cecembia lonarensis LW9]